MSDYRRFKKKASYRINKKLYSLNIDHKLFEEIKTIIMSEIDKAYRKGWNNGWVLRGDAIREDIKKYYLNSNDLELKEFFKRKWIY